MTRKDYVAFAALLNSKVNHVPQGPIFAEGWHAAVSAITHDLAKILKQDNERFDNARFLKACGIN